MHQYLSPLQKNSSYPLSISLSSSPLEGFLEMGPNDDSADRARVGMHRRRTLAVSQKKDGDNPSLEAERVSTRVSERALARTPRGRDPRSEDEVEEGERRAAWGSKNAGMKGEREREREREREEKPSSSLSAHNGPSTTTAEQRAREKVNRPPSFFLYSTVV